MDADENWGADQQPNPTTIAVGVKIMLHLKKTTKSQPFAYSVSSPVKTVNVSYERKLPGVNGCGFSKNSHDIIEFVPDIILWNVLVY